jgi:predicted ATPase
MPRFILTGAPGSGKTSLLRLLERSGRAVVEEAATAVIALEQALGADEPWLRPEFTSQVVRLQRQRELAGPARETISFFDRSPVCTLALARFLGQPVPALLTAELDRVISEGVYARTVFLVRTLGFMTPTAARRISLTESLRFEKMHEDAYSEHGFQLVEVPAAPVADRAALVCRAVAAGP